ncbi:DUF4173 domain-containing protein [Candidatus Uhrbacteria bacterium]|nr:DUF4173 domain-containing protein [Candidatus Uhrbacteria bacterium]
METSNDDRSLRIKLLWSLGTAIFWVIFLWGFWEDGVYALGLNTFVYLAAVIGLFLWSMRRRGLSLKANLFWIVPIGLIVVSFLVYDNPFLKAASIVVLPVLFAMFYNLGFLRGKEGHHWDSGLVGSLIRRSLSVLGHVVRSVSAHFRFLSAFRDGNGLVRRIVIGTVMLMVIALTVVIPLLSSADAVFAERMGGIVEWFRNLISTTAFYRVTVGIALSVLTTAALFAWGRDLTRRTEGEPDRPTDSVIAGIVLGGIMVIYLLFLWIQFRKMWVGSLPFDFRETEQLVKSGFWQLLSLSAINITLYFLIYRKTAPAVQRILLAFTVASFLLLFSAGHRMVLYVTHYGFSYEKFFALYAVLFCAVLYGWLTVSLLVRQRTDILKFLVVLFLWMYALVTVFPVEQFVLRANVALAQRPDSRIRLYELSMLSPDVLGLVRRYQAEGKLRENAYYFERARLHAGPFRTDEELAPDWSWWMDRQSRRIRDKRWFERNLMNLAVGE